LSFGFSRSFDFSFNLSFNRSFGSTSKTNAELPKAKFNNIAAIRASQPSFVQPLCLYIIF